MNKSNMCKVICLLVLCLTSFTACHGVGSENSEVSVQESSDISSSMSFEVSVQASSDISSSINSEVSVQASSSSINSEVSVQASSDISSSINSEVSVQASSDISDELDKTMVASRAYKFFTRFNRDDDKYMRVFDMDKGLMTYIKSGDKIYYSYEPKNGGKTVILFDGNAKHIKNGDGSYEVVASDGLPEADWVLDYLDITRLYGFTFLLEDDYTEAFKRYDGNNMSVQFIPDDDGKVNRIHVICSGQYSVEERELTSDDLTVFDNVTLA